MLSKCILWGRRRWIWWRCWGNHVVMPMSTVSRNGRKSLITVSKTVQTMTMSFHHLRRHWWWEGRCCCCNRGQSWWSPVHNSVSIDHPFCSNNQNLPLQRQKRLTMERYSVFTDVDILGPPDTGSVGNSSYHARHLHLRLLRVQNRGVARVPLN